MEPGAEEVRAEDHAVLVPGDRVLGGDPRFKDVRWDRCPVALAGDPECPVASAQQAWVGRMLDVFRWQQSGAPMRDVEPSPSPALIQGVLHLMGERDALEARRRRDRARG